MPQTEGGWLRRRGPSGRRRPAWKVIGGRTATLAYTTFYRQDGTQKGEVQVSYDRATLVTVRAYTVDVPSRTETIALQVPADATTARVRFRYTGGNNWYWVIDAVKITQS
ncbi:hypothetical protein ABZ719_26590 [Streptomyces sp. NPDC006743]|uniref:hypothetical protein n=1 Tax=Streptomyces sp. NPDC006743 TaxID=3154480 RepID=UPI003452AD73